MYKLRVMKILDDTIVDGPGFRTSIYVSGCKHACKNCQNPQSWNIENGEITDVLDVLKKVKSNLYNNVTFTGGDPFEQAKGLASLAFLIKKECCKTIWCYTGYTYEYLLEHGDFYQQRLLEFIDVLVDGKFEEDKKDLNLAFRGSSNQRIINVRESLTTGEVVELNEKNMFTL